jgi:hypothetical protein
LEDSVQMQNLTCKSWAVEAVADQQWLSQLLQQ